MNIKMKNYQSKLSIIMLALLTSLGAVAGTVTSIFNNGDTLTAPQMTEIKDAVNDNDSRIAAGFGGDGSAGDLTVSATHDWSTLPPANPNFANITIPVGQTLIVPAGTTIRCTGDFINNGTIEVTPGAQVQATSSIGAAGGPSQGMAGIAHPGDAFAAASSGRFHNDMTVNPKSVNGGEGGIGIPQATFLTSFNALRIGGGSGGGWTIGGTGGGLLKIYCRGAIANSGIIDAAGENGATQSGGGGGGIVILASMTSVTNTSGTINAQGGAGGSFSYGGSTGGGGGGIVGFIAPTVASTGGSVNVAGGVAQTATGSVSSDNAYGGAGGGASGGDGGRGGSVSSTLTKNSGANGTDGYVVEMQVNPANMMF